MNVFIWKGKGKVGAASSLTAATGREEWGIDGSFTRRSRAALGHGHGVWYWGHYTNTVRSNIVLNGRRHIHIWNNQDDRKAMEHFSVTGS